MDKEYRNRVVKVLLTEKEYQRIKWLSYKNTIPLSVMFRVAMKRYLDRMKDDDFDY